MDQKQFVTNMAYTGANPTGGLVKDSVGFLANHWQDIVNFFKRGINPGTEFKAGTSGTKHYVNNKQNVTNSVPDYYDVEIGGIPELWVDQITPGQLELMKKGYTNARPFKRTNLYDLSAKESQFQNSGNIQNLGPNADRYLDINNVVGTNSAAAQQIHQALQTHAMRQQQPVQQQAPVAPGKRNAALAALYGGRYQDEINPLNGQAFYTQ